MITKNKSNQIKALKYLLVLPILSAMLVFSSCLEDTVESSDDLTQEKDLSEYTFSFKLLEYSKDPTIKDKMDKQKEFIKENPDYVIWQIGDTISMTNSLHHKEEPIPQGYIILNEENNDPLFSLYTNDKENKILVVLEGLQNSMNSGNNQVPFALVDKVPTYPGCEEGNDEIKKSCMSESIAKFVNKNFNIELAHTLNLVGKQRIITAFKISSTGDIIDVKARAPHPDLQAEAIRVVKLLPKMIPGEHKGKKVVVPYSLPILFVINEKDN